MRAATSASILRIISVFFLQIAGRIVTLAILAMNPIIVACRVAIVLVADRRTVELLRKPPMAIRVSHRYIGLVGPERARV